MSYNSGTGAFSITQSSGSTNGYLSSTDWTTFNSKQSALTNPVTGTGTLNTIVKFTATGTTVGNSNITDNGTTVTFSTALSGTSATFSSSVTALKYIANAQSTYASLTYEETFKYSSSPAGIWFGNSFNSNNNVALQLRTSNDGTSVQALTITPTGNVGIGTSSPTDFGSSYGTLEFNAPSFPVFVMSCAGVKQFETIVSTTETILGTFTNTPLEFYTNSTERMRITSGGIINTTSRLNVNGAVDNSLFSLNSGGTLYTGGFSPNATANSTNTLTLTNGQTTWIYNGSGIATWTLFNPSGTNQMIWIKNAGTGIITLNAYSGTNIINNAGSSVSSITIAVGATVLIQQDGNVKSYQLQ